jgi:hypothetical protein
MSLSDSNRPLRVFEKVLQGGLGAGNIGVIAARMGTGKHAVLTTIAIDHALGGHQTLHMAVNERVEDVRAYDDEILNEMLTSLGAENPAKVATEVERNKLIYTFTDGNFTATRMRQTLDFLREHAQFRPLLIEIQGWPNFEEVTPEEMLKLKNIAGEYGCEIWCSCLTHRGDFDDNSMPDYLARFDDIISVLVTLDPKDTGVALRFLKTKDFDPPKDAHLEFDPKSMAIRWS